MSIPSNLNYSDPRESGRQAVKDTVSPEVWESNIKFTEKLKTLLLKHPVFSVNLI